MPPKTPRIFSLGGTGNSLLRILGHSEGVRTTAEPGPWVLELAAWGLTLSSEILESTARQIELEEICLREPSVGCHRQLGRVGHHVGVRYVKVA